MDEKLIEDIRQYILSKTGILYFKDIRKTPNNLIVTCPFHKGGQENKPSAGIRTTDNPSTPIGMFHCFTCGETMTLSNVVAQLLGKLYNENEVEARFGLKLLSSQQIFTNKNVFKFNIPNKLSRNETELNYYRQYHPYLAQRGISENTAMVYDIGYDNNNQQITFPIRDVNRNCIGIGRRNIFKKFYRYPEGMIKPLYGVYELPRNINYLWVVEGPFNLWSLYEYGKSGVALLGTGTDAQYKELHTINCNGYVLALDPDEAGRKGTYKIYKSLHDVRNKPIYVLDLPNGKDVNDISREEFNNIQVLTYNEWRIKYGY